MKNIDDAARVDLLSVVGSQLSAASRPGDEPQTTDHRPLTTTRVAIAGATGYAGAELEKILSRHKHAEVVAAFSSGSFSLEALFAATPDLVFLATPNEVSAELVPAILDAGIKVIDLSGAFRLGEPSLYPSWYGFTHTRPELLGEAVYGLPEWCNGELKKARLVANPGCYPTSILLALRPLTYLLDRTQPVICDSKSGVSGAGKKADVAFSFSELFGNFKAYGVGSIGTSRRSARDCTSANAPRSCSSRICCRRCAGSTRRCTSRSQTP
jgi:hypothetical protein